MKDFFVIDNPIFSFLGKIADLLILNFLWLICCLPVITIGPATTALYSVSLKIVSGKEPPIFRTFFDSFKKNLKQGCILSVLLLVFSVILYANYMFFMSASDNLHPAFFVINFAFCIIFFMALLYTFPLLAAYEHTTKQLLKNALFLSIGKLIVSIIVVIIHIILIVVTVMLPFNYIPTWICVGPVLVALLSSKIHYYTFSKVFLK